MTGKLVCSRLRFSPKLLAANGEGFHSNHGVSNCRSQLKSGSRLKSESRLSSAWVADQTWINLVPQSDRGGGLSERDPFGKSHFISIAAFHIARKTGTDM